MSPSFPSTTSFYPFLFHYPILLIHPAARKPFFSLLNQSAIHKSHTSSCLISHACSCLISHLFCYIPPSPVNSQLSDMYSLVLFVAMVVVCSGFRSTFYRPSCTLRSSLHMNLADRVFRVVKSNVNSIISNMEDPEKVLDQTVNDMQNDLVIHLFLS